MPEKYPPELIFRSQQPDAWFECWQEEDFDFGHPDAAHEPTEAQLEASSIEVDLYDVSWLDQDYGEAPYKLF